MGLEVACLCHWAKMKGRAKQNGCCLANFLCHFRVLLSGVWPAKGWKQKPVDGSVGHAEGRFWHGRSGVSSLRSRQTQTTSAIIWAQPCRENRSTSPITDLRATAGWRASLVDSAERCLSEKHDLFNNVDRLSCATRHTAYGGVCQHFGGNPVLV